MQPRPLRTTVIGSYPFPAWLEAACAQLECFGADDLAEVQDDAVIAALHDQLAAGLDVVTDGEQTRLDFNLSWGPPAHDQRGKHRVTGELRAPHGLGAVEEFQRLQRLASFTIQNSSFTIPTLKASVPGPYTLSGRLLPSAQYPAATSSPRRSSRSSSANSSPSSKPAAARSPSMSPR